MLRSSTSPPSSASKFQRAYSRRDGGEGSAVADSGDVSLDAKTGRWAWAPGLSMSREPSDARAVREAWTVKGRTFQNFIGRR
jgi:hypothetical protein